MRLSAFAVIAASAALGEHNCLFDQKCRLTRVIPVQVSAAPAPLRLLVVTSVEEDSPFKDSPFKGVRFGHAVPFINRDLLNTSPPASLPASDIPTSPGGQPLPSKPFRHRTGCHGKKAKVAIFIHRIKIKAIKIGNCFRKALGWPLIEVKHHPHHHHHHTQPPHHSKDGKDAEAGGIQVDGGFISILPFPAVTAAKGGDWAGDVSDRPHYRHHRHHTSFLSRLHNSLMNLGRWEGRAVAFVIGVYLSFCLKGWLTMYVTFDRLRYRCPYPHVLGPRYRVLPRLQRPQ